MSDKKDVVNIVWLHRDIRIDDNRAMQMAIKDGKSVLVIYIFDDNLIRNKSVNLPGLKFLYEQLQILNIKLLKYGSSVLIKKGDPITVFEEILEQFNINCIFANTEYEPYSILRDDKLKEFCLQRNIGFQLSKDHVIYGPEEVMKADGLPYQVFTAYKNKWLQLIEEESFHFEPLSFELFYKSIFSFPSKSELGINEIHQPVKSFSLDHIDEYQAKRDFPYLDAGSYLGPYLRYGVISIRKLVKQIMNADPVFLSAIIWREFFIQILYHFPYVVDSSFKKKYDFVGWDNNEKLFLLWQQGKTGYPIVDAGMRELNETGYMHNRVRMVTASFLCKHLLIDWRWGESYFASKLQDYELASNNGNWQWVAGSGCDAAPYFRVFNPITQQKKFDAELNYIKKWVPEFGSSEYSLPIVEYAYGRKRAIEAYKKALTPNMH